MEYAGILSKEGLKRARNISLASALISAKKRGMRVRMLSEIDDQNVANFLSKHFELHRSRELLSI